MNGLERRRTHGGKLGITHLDKQTVRIYTKGMNRINYSERYLQSKRSAHYTHIINEVTIYTKEVSKLIVLGFALTLVVVVLVGLIK